MLATIEQLSVLAETAEDPSKDRLRSHIAKMLAKIRTGKRPRTNNGQECVEAELS
jgi:hypothetical protein